MANINWAVANIPTDLNFTYYKKFRIHISKSVAAEKRFSASRESKTRKKRE